MTDRVPERCAIVHTRTMTAGIESKRACDPSGSAGAYAPEADHSYIGFKVAKPALERAFATIRVFNLSRRQ